MIDEWCMLLHPDSHSVIPHISFCHSPVSPVFRPGENGMYWYVVVTGTLDMLHVDPRNDQKVEPQ